GLGDHRSNGGGGFRIEFRMHHRSPLLDDDGNGFLDKPALASAGFAGKKGHAEPVAFNGGTPEFHNASGLDGSSDKGKNTMIQKIYERCMHGHLGSRHPVGPDGSP